MMSAFARWCYRHRFVVIAAWAGLLIGLAVLSQAVKTSYDNSLTLPGTGSGSAQELLRSVPAQAGDADQIVWRVSQGSVRDRAIEQRMSAMLARVSHLPEVAFVASPYRPGATVQVRSSDGRTAYATVSFTKAADNLDKAGINRVVAAAAAAREPGLAVELGGLAISHAEEESLSSASAIGIGAAAVILLIAFGSVLAMALPIVTAG